MPEPSRSEKSCKRCYKAIACTTPGKLEIRDFGCSAREGITCPRTEPDNTVLLPAAPAVREHFVGIAVEGCGICGTDVHLYQGKRFLHETADAANVLIPGHEIFGTVVEAGGAYRPLLGKTVVVDPIIDCYGADRCRFCASGKNYLHTPFTEMGICGGVPGGFAEYTTALGQNCFPVEGLNHKQKALIEPLATLTYAYRDVLRVSPEARSYCLLGSGPAGLLSVQYLKHKNSANHVVVVDKNPFKLSTARDLGADETICIRDMQPDEIETALLAMTENRGFDHVCELSGSNEAVALIPRIAARLSSALLYGLGHGTVTFENFDMIVEKEISLLPALGASNKESFREAVRIISGFSVDPIITHVYRGLDQVEFAITRDYYDKHYVKGVLLL